MNLIDVVKLKLLTIWLSLNPNKELIILLHKVLIILKYQEKKYKDGSMEYPGLCSLIFSSGFTKSEATKLDYIIIKYGVMIPQWTPYYFPMFKIAPRITFIKSIIKELRK